MKSQLVLASIVIAWTLAAPPGAAARADCAALPTSALQTRPCNPREECLKTIPADATSAQRAARQEECARLPVTGVCHGPATYNPQAECLAAQRKR